MLPPKRSFPRLVDETEKPAQIEFDVLDVTRLLMVLDSGLKLEFDFVDPATEYIDFDDKDLMNVRLGDRRIRIAKSRILYYETFPHQLKRPKQPLTDIIAAIQKQ